jgi:hypothetical protein
MDTTKRKDINIFINFYLFPDIYEVKGFQYEHYFTIFVKSKDFLGLTLSREAQKCFPKTFCNTSKSKHFLKLTLSRIITKDFQRSIISKVKMFTFFVVYVPSKCEVLGCLDV